METFPMIMQGFDGDLSLRESHDFAQLYRIISVSLAAYCVMICIFMCILYSINVSISQYVFRNFFVIC